MTIEVVSFLIPCLLDLEKFVTQNYQSNRLERKVSKHALSCLRSRISLSLQLKLLIFPNCQSTLQQNNLGKWGVPTHVAVNTVFTEPRFLVSLSHYLLPEFCFMFLSCQTSPPFTDSHSVPCWGPASILYQLEPWEIFQKINTAWQIIYYFLLTSVY